ncbi:hypothetical protein BJX61DRAFT_141286 [Aspergillus egyptiacus]|nr:hypothetical protein BJX61DRAFT_141286 [Aspergillus egyptiacus]
MWKLFATAYPAQFSELEHYRSMNIENPRVSMREYLELVKSDKLSWLVVLTLGTSYARVPELVGISDITNLVALEIATPPPRRGVPPEEPSIPVTALTDRIIRTWSELAQTAGAFPHLRLLILQHQRALSKVALRYLRALPALQFVVVDSCDDIASAVYGNEVDEWTVVERKHFPSKLHEFYLSTCSRSRREELAPVEPPILDFQVGQKKRRSNNTRCHSPIYLQRTELKVGEVDPEPSNRKRKEGAADSQLNGSQPRKAVMKDRTMDIGDVLKGFF